MDPNDILKHPEQIKALISVLQQLLNNSEPNEQTEKQPEKKHVASSKSNPNMKTKSRQKVGSKNRIKSKTVESEAVNKFEKMSEFRMHKDDCVIDKKLSVAPPVARMRDFEFIDVTCRVCGKTENIAPALLFDSPSRYKCNNCSTQSG